MTENGFDKAAATITINNAVAMSANVPNENCGITWSGW
jgi:hypothetical protein